jgi:electron transfer flavoprotein alpha subunit
VPALVVAEVRDGKVTEASFEAVAAARRLEEPVTIVVPGADVSEACGELAALDVTDVVALEHPALSSYTADGFVAALSAYVGQTTPSWVVLPHSYTSRDFVPALATRLGGSLVTDCVAIERTPDGLVLSRPIFQGKVVASLSFDGPPPWLVTVQAGVFGTEGMRQERGSPSVRRHRADCDGVTIRQRPEPPFEEIRRAVNLGDAERIVAIGRGIKDKDRVRVAEELAAALGAELAASRPICDAGWLPMDRQVGSSGQTVTPKLYVALGISGAIQHVLGMKGARTIVAINRDADAPIFDVADYGIVGDLFEVVPAMIAALKG